MSTLSGRAEPRGARGTTAAESIRFATSSEHRILLAADAGRPLLAISTSYPEQAKPTEGSWAGSVSAAGGSAQCCTSSALSK
jgi:hypothetical protein